MKKLIIGILIILPAIFISSQSSSNNENFDIVGTWKGHEEVRMSYKKNEQETFLGDFYVEFTSSQDLKIDFKEDVFIKRKWSKFLREQGITIEGYTWIPRNSESGYLQLDASCVCPKKILDDGEEVDSEYVEMFQNLNRSKVTIYDNNKIGIHIIKANGENHVVVLERE